MHTISKEMGVMLAVGGWPELLLHGVVSGYPHTERGAA